VADKSIRLRVVASATGLQVFDDAGKKLDRVRSASTTANKALGLMTGGIGKLTATIGTLAAGAVSIYGVQKAIGGFITEGDRLHKLNLQLEESTEFLSEMAFVADRQGVNFEQFEKGIRKLSRGMGEAAEFMSGEALRAWQALGLEADIVKGKYKSVEDLLPVLADKFAEIENAQTKAGYAALLFGERGMKMLQVLNMGSAEIEIMRDRARELGVTFTQDMAEKAAAAKDAALDLTSAVKGIRNVFVSDFVPYITAGLELVTEGIVELKKDGSLETWANNTIEAGRVVVQVFDKVWKVISAIYSVQQKISWLIPSSGAPAALLNWLLGDGDESEESINSFFDKLKLKAEKSKERLKALNYDDILLGGDDKKKDDDKRNKRYFEEQKEKQRRKQIEADYLRLHEETTLKIIELSEGEYDAKMEALNRWLTDSIEVYKEAGKANQELYERYSLQADRYEKEEKERRKKKEQEEGEQFENLEKAAEDSWKTIESGLVDSVWSAVAESENAAEAFKRIWLGVAEDIGRDFLRSMTQDLMGGAGAGAWDLAKSGFNMAMSFLGGLGSGGGGGGWAGAGVPTSGYGGWGDTGRNPLPWYFESGGLSPGEIPAVLHQGEAVIPNNVVSQRPRSYWEDMISGNLFENAPRFAGGGILEYFFPVNNDPASWRPLPLGPGTQRPERQTEIDKIPRATQELWDWAAIKPQGNYAIPYYYYDQYGQIAEDVFAAELMGGGKGRGWNAQNLSNQDSVEARQVRALFEMRSRYSSYIPESPPLGLSQQIGGHFQFYFGGMGFEPKIPEASPLPIPPGQDNWIMPGAEYLSRAGWEAEVYGMLGRSRGWHYNEERTSLKPTMSSYGVGGDVDMLTPEAMSYLAENMSPYIPRSVRERMAETYNENLPILAAQYQAVMSQEGYGDRAKLLSYELQRYRNIKRALDAWAEIGGPVPEFHSGGLNANETLAVLEKEEAVISAPVVSRNRELVEGLIRGAPRFHEGGIAGGSPGGGSGSIPNVRVEVNASSAPGITLNVDEGEISYTMNEMIKTVMIEAIHSDPRISAMLGGG